MITRLFPKRLCVITVIVTIGLVAGQGKKIKDCMPPSISDDYLEDEIFFIEDGMLELACMATGNDTLVYSWIKNGVKLDVKSGTNNGRMSMRLGVGTLIINPAQDEDEGIYQCEVQNSCGTSLSIKSHVQRARLEPFQAVVEPKHLVKGLGHHMELKCNPPVSIPEAAISWIIWDASKAKRKKGSKGAPYTGTQLILNDRITTDYQGNLHITNLRKDDSQNGSKYLCVANNVQVRSWVQGEDKIVETLGDQQSALPVDKVWFSESSVMGLVGESVSFKCIFSGNPQPKIEWRRIGKQKDRKRMSQSDDFFEFTINEVEYGDAGEYECRGSNDHTNRPITNRFTLTVESEPYWVNEPVDQDVGVEEDAVFPCKAMGTPVPKVEWFINGKPLADAKPSQDRLLQDNKLIFKNLSEGDSQVVQCNVSNKHGYKWADVYLHVLAIPAKIIAPPTYQKIAVSHDVTIMCKSEGKPKPQVTWYKGDQQLSWQSGSISNKRYKLLPSGNLLIKNVRLKDKGHYRCDVRNRFGRDSSMGELAVREKTKIRDSPEDVQLVHGNEAMFSCVATTDSLERDFLRYVWYKNGKKINQSDPRIRQQDGRLRILDTTSSDSANYTCMATNGLDNSTAVAKLEVKAPPEPPRNVKMLQCLARKAQISWEFDKRQENFSPLENFILEYNTSYNPNEWIVGKRPKKTFRQASITLSPYANYTFRMKAVNSIGVGEPSKHTITLCETPRARPDHHPKGVKTVGEKTNRLIIEWEPMELIEHNGPEFEYVITIQEDTKDGNVSKIQDIHIDDYKTGRYELEVDTVYKPYIITVSAKNQVGEPIKKVKKVRGFSGEAAPLVTPSNFELDPDKKVTATSAGFQWDPVDTSPEVIRGEFQGYKIRFWKRGQMETTKREVFIPHKPSKQRRRRRQAAKIKADVTSLPSFVEVEADVVAVNTFFESNSSNSINFSTPEGVPSPVKYFLAILHGSTHFYLEWGEPAEMNGDLLGYDLGYQKISGLDFGDIEDGPKIDDPEKRRAFLGGLEPDTHYRVYVWGRTVKGRGKPYFIDVKTTEEDPVLVRPIIIDILAGLNSANVSWDVPGREGARVGSHYYVEYRKIGHDDWKKADEEKTEEFWQVVRNLESGTSYEARIITKTNDDIYGHSEPKGFTTAGVVGTKTSSFLSAGWFIGMMVAIAILLLILIIVCIIKRNRGDKYHVQEKERLRGSNPDDNQDHFNEYTKSDENGIGQSGSFSNDPEKMPLEDETDSMEEYGDVDPCKFNEDGSFIGQYGGQKSGSGVEPSNQSAMSTLV